MSRSRNTKPIKFKIDDSNSDFLPRIIERKPKLGDIHPLSKKDVLNYLSTIPEEYLYKLEIIELSPRPKDPGDPLGRYYPSDKKIVLYSHPTKFIQSDIIYCLLYHLMSKNGDPAPDTWEIIDNKLHVEWDFAKLRKLYLEEVLPHEFGHHFYYINKNRRKLPKFKYHEILADIHKDKINNYLKIKSDVNKYTKILK